MRLRLVVGWVFELAAAVCLAVAFSKLWTLTRGAYYGPEGYFPDPLPTLVAAVILHLIGLAILLLGASGRLAGRFGRRS